ncbi:MAG: hypothetical protein ACOYMG_02420 [Candidatus Methylumidiphilus sp.]
MSDDQTIQAVRFENGKFSIVSFGQHSDCCPPKKFEFARVLDMLSEDYEAEAPYTSSFISPFGAIQAVIPCNEEVPYALVIDPNLDVAEPVYLLIGTLFFFRLSPNGKDIATVVEGDIDAVRRLPFWLRFDRLEREETFPGVRPGVDVSIIFHGNENQCEV